MKLSGRAGESVWECVGQGTGRCITPTTIFSTCADDLTPRFQLLVLVCRDCDESWKNNYNIYWTLPSLLNLPSASLHRLV